MYDNIGFQKGRESRCDSYQVRKQKAEAEAREQAEEWKEYSCFQKLYLTLHGWVCLCTCFRCDCCDWIGWIICRRRDEYTQPYADRCSELETGSSKFSNLRY